MSSAVTGYATT